jgi:glycosyltransferase involved in cell wall biosynthesis
MTLINKNTKNRLVIFTPSLSGGGMERVISILSLNAPEDVDMIILTLKKDVAYCVRHPILCLGDYSNIFGAIKSYIRLNKFLREYKPDALLIFGAAQGLSLALLSLCKNKILTIRNYNFEPTRKRKYKQAYFNLLISKVAKILTRKIIVISQPIKHKLIKRYSIPPSKISIIHNPIDTKTTLKLASEKLEDGEEEIFNGSVLINVGRLIRQKGQWYLLRIFKKVVEEIPEARLVLIGQGGLQDDLKKLSSRLGIDNSVFFLGWRSNPFKYMARSKLFCLTSLWEGFPNVVIESLACSLPVMSTDCLSGPREILAPGTEYKAERLREPEYAEYGILMPVMDGKLYSASDPLTWQEEVWAEELIKLLKDSRPLEEYREKALKRALDFDAEKQAKKYFETRLLFVSS